MTRSSKTHHFAPSSVESTTTSYILSLPSLSPPFLIQTPPPLLASHEKFRCHPARQLFHLRHLFFNINDDKQSSSVLVETSENPIDSHQTQSSEPTIDQSDSSYELSIALKKSSTLICNPHPTYIFLSFHSLYPFYFAFISVSSSVTIPKIVREALTHPGWKQVMIDEM